jgi:hypothetical protein
MMVKKQILRLTDLHVLGPPEYKKVVSGKLSPHLCVCVCVCVYVRLCSPWTDVDYISVIYGDYCPK